MLIFNKAIYQSLDPALNWFKRNKLRGFIAYTLIFVIWIPLALPPIILTLSGGFIFSKAFGAFTGFFLCMLAIWIGHPIGALIAFTLGRLCCKKYIQKNLLDEVKVFQAIDRGLHSQGVRIAILLRVQQVIPWFILNYLMAVSSCDTRTFLIGTVVGMLPNTCMTIYVGINLDKISDLANGK